MHVLHLWTRVALIFSHRLTWQLFPTTQENCRVECYHVRMLLQTRHTQQPVGVL